MSTDIVNLNTQVNNQQKKAIHLKYILDQEKQFIDLNNKLHPTGTLTTTLPKPTREENPYV